MSPCGLEESLQSPHGWKGGRPWSLNTSPRLSLAFAAEPDHPQPRPASLWPQVDLSAGLGDVPEDTAPPQAAAGDSASWPSPTARPGDEG